MGTVSRAAVRRVRWPEDLETVRRLFREYRHWLADHQDPTPSAKAKVDSGLAEVDALINGLPGVYDSPRGDVLLWFEGEDVVACGVLRELEPNVGEIKRVFVRSDYRGKEFGPHFVRALIDRARELGYRKLKVDTLASMSAAIEFYQEMGFRPAEPFWSHPAVGARFFEAEIH